MHFASYNTEISFSSSYVRGDVFTDQFGSVERLGNRRIRYRDQLDSGDVLTTPPGEVRTALLPEREQHDCRGCQRVVINVSGMRFETHLKTLERLPNTLLGDPAKRIKFWDPRRQEYFFDRHRPTFEAVLYFYQSGGKLKRPLEVPSDVFFNELEFYELGATVIDSYKQNEGYLLEKKTLLPDGKLQRTLWLLFEEPSSSWMATFIMALSIMAIIASLVGFCMETLPEYRNNSCVYNNTDGFVLDDISSMITPIEVHSNQTANATTLSSGWFAQKKAPNYRDPFFIIDAVCVSWFTIEFCIRMYSCPSKCDFLKSMVNIVDIIAIVPFFVTLLIGVASGTCVNTSSSGFLLTLRVIKVMRVFKLGKHSQGLQIVAKTISASIGELSLFAMFLGIAVVLFSAAMYFAEYDANPGLFPSIPHAFWYTIVTMTTVGYGDAVPIGFAGKIIGSFCVLAGVLVIALPVPVIVSHFSTYYLHATGRGMTMVR